MWHSVLSVTWLPVGQRNVLSTLMMEAAGFPNMSVTTYQTARFHSSEGSLIYIITILKTWKLSWRYCPIPKKGRWF